MHLYRIQAIAEVVVKELYRRKDFYVLFIITMLLTIVAGSANFFNDDRIVRYLKELSLMLIWGSSLVVAVTVTARQLPSERESRTIFPLLAKPVSRAEVVLGKFLGCWLACGIALVLFYTFMAVFLATRQTDFSLGLFLQAVISHWILLAVVIAFTLLGSLVFSAPSVAATLAFVLTTGILLAGRHLGKIALQFLEPTRTALYALYFTIPQLSFFDVRDLLVHGQHAIPAFYWMASLVYGFIYVGLFLGAACWVFRRQPLSR